MQKTSAIMISGRKEVECRIAKELGKRFELVVPGFGAFDYRCSRHMFYAQELP